MADRAANDADAVPISARFISEPAQEFRTLGRQGERNGNHFCKERRSPVRRWFSFSNLSVTATTTTAVCMLICPELSEEKTRRTGDRRSLRNFIAFILAFLPSPPRSAQRRSSSRLWP